MEFVSIFSFFVVVEGFWFGNNRKNVNGKVGDGVEGSEFLYIHVENYILISSTQLSFEDRDSQFQII
jgi:hypothetical protein